LLSTSLYTAFKVNRPLLHGFPDGLRGDSHRAEQTHCVLRQAAEKSVLPPFFPPLLQNPPLIVFGGFQQDPPLLYGVADLLLEQPSLLQ